MTESVETVAVSKEITLKEFFENIPPGKFVKIKNLSKRQNSSNYLNLTAIELHCETSECNGVRFFNPQENVHIGGINAYNEVFLTFICRNCNKSSKTYAFLVKLGENASDNSLHKLGEFPPFGPPTPARVFNLIGAEREYYLKGRRAENQDLGIAAFAYYRRVVENQKTRIIDEIIRVGKKVGASEEVLRDLVAAKSETQFSKAVDAIKHGIPQSLLIDGHNPLVLLHSALSEGLHAHTDEQCLELATSIRVVLSELVERMGLALKEEVALSTAVTRLLSANSQKGKRDTN